MFATTQDTPMRFASCLLISLLAVPAAIASDCAVNKAVFSDGSTEVTGLTYGEANQGHRFLKVLGVEMDGAEQFIVTTIVPQLASSSETLTAAPEGISLSDTAVMRAEDQFGEFRLVRCL